MEITAWLARGGGGEVLPYISHIGMCRPPAQRVGLLGLFGLKTGITFPVLVWNRVWLSRGLRERMSKIIVSIPNE